MIFKLRITTTEEMTIERDSQQDALDLAAYKQEERRQHCHHGEVVTAEILPQVATGAVTDFDKVACGLVRSALSLRDGCGAGAIDEAGMIKVTAAILRMFAEELVQTHSFSTEDPSLPLGMGGATKWDQEIDAEGTVGVPDVSRRRGQFREVRHMPRLRQHRAHEVAAGQGVGTGVLGFRRPRPRLLYVQP